MKSVLILFSVFAVVICYAQMIPPTNNVPPPSLAKAAKQNAANANAKSVAGLKPATLLIRKNTNDPVVYHWVELNRAPGPYDGYPNVDTLWEGTSDLSSKPIQWKPVAQVHGIHATNQIDWMTQMMLFRAKYIFNTN